MNTLGIDVGSLAMKAVVLKDDDARVMNKGKTGLGRVHLYV